jgi:glycoside hydrolase-like protein
VSSRAAPAFGVLLLASAAACDSAGGRIAGIDGSQSRQSFPGFDVAVYPGDALMSAWRRPSSPYHWVGYYLAAPCHRDVTWMGKRPSVSSLGWGTLVIYVGQQDWARIPNTIATTRASVVDWPAIDIDLPRATSSSAAAAVTCSATLLTAAQGALEADDAITKTASEGFPVGSSIYLDVEYVTAVSPELKEYITAWIGAVLRDGRYVPAIYAAKSNAPEIHQVAAAAFGAAGRTDAPSFWIASSSGFDLTSHPTDVGLPYAAAWQGRFDVAEQWSGRALTIDVNVASTRSPSAPLASSALLSTR